MKRIITLVLCLLLALALLGGGAYFYYTRQFLPTRAYTAAEALLTAGDVTGAETAFLALGDYADAPARVMECRDLLEQQRLQADYAAAEALLNSGSLTEAVAAFEALGDHADAAERAEEARAALEQQQLQAQYAAAEALLENGSFAEAIAAFEALGDYSDAADRAAAIPSSGRYLAAQLRELAVGDHCIWGSYEQDNDLTNGAEPLEWLVLAKEEERILLITTYCIDTRAWNDTWVPCTWENCEMRRWLNSGFMDTAFTAEEQSVILLTDLENAMNPFHSISSGNDTRDRVFLLSYDEAASLFEYNSQRRAVSTAYAKANRAFCGETGGSRWWLRTSGWDNYYAVYVHSDGHVVNYDSCQTYADYWTVRPALWLNLS